MSGAQNNFESFDNANANVSNSLTVHINLLKDEQCNNDPNAQDSKRPSSSVDVRDGDKPQLFGDVGNTDGADRWQDQSCFLENQNLAKGTQESTSINLVSSLGTRDDGGQTGEVFLMAMPVKENSTNTIEWTDYLAFKGIFKVAKIDFKICPTATKYSFLKAMWLYAPTYLHIDGHGDERGNWLVAREYKCGCRIPYDDKYEVEEMSEVWKLFRGLKVASLDFCNSFKMCADIKRSRPELPEAYGIPIVSIRG